MNSLQKEQGSMHVIITTVVAVAILGSLGLVFWQNFINKKASTSADTNTTTSTRADTTVQAASDTGDKMYKNTSLGFSLSYPSDWTVTEGASGTNDVILLASPATIAAHKTNASADSTGYDITIQSQPQSGSTNSFSSGAILALKGNAAEYASMKYVEAINSFNVTEYDMYAQSPYFVAIFPIGSNYVELDFNQTATKSDMTETLTRVLQSVKAL